MSSKFLSLSFILTFFFLGSVQAQEVRNFFSGTRMMGMGGAGIAVSNDETALLENPAGLGRLRDAYGTVIDPEVEGNSNSGPFNKAKVLTDPTNLAQVKPQLDNHPDTEYHAKEAVFPSFVVRNFGVGVYWRKSLDAIEDPTGANVTANYYDDLALLLGTDVRFFDGRVKIGVTGKFIDRISIENKTIATTSPFDIKSNASEGAGIGADAGIILTAPWAWLPTASAVVRDVGGTSFTAGSGLRLTEATRPSPLTQDIDLAVALFPIHANKTRSTFTVEYDKIKEASTDHDKVRYVHVGYELNFYDSLFLRAGMNQRYWTGGLELATEHTQLQLASYGEDIGLTGHPQEDRRYMFKFAYRF